MRAYLAELFATFVLIFIGAGSVVVNQHTGGAVGLMGIAVAHGLAIVFGINVIGHISGAHINPAVTVAMLVTKRISASRALGYIISQLLGALVAGILLSALLPETASTAVHLGATQLASGIGYGTGFVLEVLLTFLLVMAIFGTVVDPRGNKSTASFVIGLTITMGIFIGGPLTGAALNPARFFGPAFASGMWANCGVYWFGPIVGAVLAALFYDKLLLQKS
ncbi:MAG: MIP family channel protein [Deltaproteobacteria bacterium]|nr:MIP family channel protein [Deltaproteobacteria bacterium]